MSAEPVVLYGSEDGVARVTLNRPAALNAWTPELGSEYFDRLQQAEADPEVTAIVVTGAGRGFCAGADFEYLEKVDQDGASPTHARRVFPEPCASRR
jgi:enoyl-CoA hydratase/carnithine racemase